MSLLKLTVDRQNETLAARNGTPTTLPALFQYNVKPLQIQFVDPTGQIGTGTDYSPVDMSGFGLRVALTPTPTGTPGGPAVLALQTSWTWNAANQWFTGSLDLSSSAIESYLAGNASATAYFEITLTQSGNRITAFQSQITLKAVGDEGTATAPSLTEQYLTKSETQAGFVPRVMENGGTIVIPSANGAYAIELKCNDDGSFSASTITL